MINCFIAKKYPSLLLVFVFISGFCYSQVKTIIQPQKIISTKVVVLRSRKNKDTDTLKIPVVSSVYPKLKAALCDTALFDGDTLAAVIKAYADEDPGITSLDYKVTFLNKDIISIVLYYESVGAHPDSYEKWLTLNVNTGKPYAINNEITSSGMVWVLNNYKMLMKNRILAVKKEYGPKMDKETFEMLNEAIDGLTVEDLAHKYVFTKNGVRFSMDQILPHPVKNMEPVRDWDIRYGVLKGVTAPSAIIINK